MYKHLVLWKLKNYFNGMNKESLAMEVKKRLDSLPAAIPEIVGFETGINIGAYGASFYDVGLISSFVSEAEFKTYCTNPVHDAVVEYIQSVTEAEEIVDFHCYLG